MVLYTVDDYALHRKLGLCSRALRMEHLFGLWRAVSAVRARAQRADFLHFRMLRKLYLTTCFFFACGAQSARETKPRAPAMQVGRETKFGRHLLWLCGTLRGSTQDPHAYSCSLYERAISRFGHFLILKASRSGRFET